MGFEVIIAFDEYIDPGQMYHNIITNMTSPEDGSYNPTGLKYKFGDYQIADGASPGTQTQHAILGVLYELVC